MAPRQGFRFLVMRFSDANCGDGGPGFPLTHCYCGGFDNFQIIQTGQEILYEQLGGLDAVHLLHVWLDAPARGGGF